MQLRPYQVEAHNAFFVHYIERALKDHSLILMPTGTGKSPVIASIIQTAMRLFPTMRFLVLTGTRDLVEQDAKAIVQMNPNIPVGICCSGLNRTDVAHPVIVGSPGTVVSRIEAIGRIDVILVDEAQDVSDKIDSDYLKIIRGLTAMNPNVNLCGFTATAYRMGMGMLTNGGVFKTIIYDCTTPAHFEMFLKNGWLAPLVSGPTRSSYDRSNLKVRGGDFTEASMDTVALNEAVTQACVDEYLAGTANRHSGLAFATSIKHAEMICDMMEAAGASATVIHSKLKKTQIDARMAEFKRGEHRYLINKDKYTVGFDHRPVDSLGIFRPTMSAGLWVQILGRGTRPYDPATAPAELARYFQYLKTSCFVFDFAGNILELGPIDSPRIPNKKGKGGGDAPVRICPKCQMYNHASARFCGGPVETRVVGCGEEFHNELRIDLSNTGHALMSVMEEKIIEELPVSRVLYSPHTKEGRPTTLKATYYCRGKSYNEFIAFEGQGFARKRAEWWYRERTGKHLVPPTTADVLSMTTLFKTPAVIHVHTNKRPYPEIVRHEFHT
ncbi:putative DNA helicase [Achromobacter phage vB_AxyS_19-32_Axy19]|nr:putative DNA helicase [Achromobacter phage vB_AxyS_19-32_Axy19]